MSLHKCCKKCMLFPPTAVEIKSVSLKKHLPKSDNSVYFFPAIAYQVTLMPWMYYTLCVEHYCSASYGMLRQTTLLCYSDITTALT